MRDLISPEELARFWVHLGDPERLRQLVELHSGDDTGRCKGCRSRTVSPCMFQWAAEQAGVELWRREKLMGHRR